MIDFRRLLWSFSAALLSLLFCVPVCRGQSEGGPQQSVSGAKDTSTPGSDQAGGSSGSFSGGLPGPFQRHWVGRLSIGEVGEKGLRNGLFTNYGSPYVTSTEASASLAYDLRKAHSDYLFNYNGSARHYNRYSQLDVVTHDLGLVQSVEFGPRTRWSLKYHFTMTPDFAGGLITDTLSQQMSSINPVPANGIRGIPTLGAPFPALLSPADGLVPLRSTQMTHVAFADFSQDLSAQTKLDFQAGFRRMSFQDKNLFGSNTYNLGAQVSHLLTAGTDIGIGYQGIRWDLMDASYRTMSQGVMLFFRKQLGRRSVLTLQGGPARIETQGQRVIPLPSLLGNLLGRTSLNPSAPHAFIGWLGSGSLATNIHGVSFSLSGERSIRGTEGIGGASLSEGGAVSVAKEFRQRTVISVQVSYLHFEFLGIQNPFRMDQEGLAADFTRKLSRALDFNAFFFYAKALRGLHGPVLLERNRVGVRFVVHFPRVGVAGS